MNENWDSVVRLRQICSSGRFVEEKKKEIRTAPDLRALSFFPFSATNFSMNNAKMEFP